MGTSFFPHFQSVNPLPALSDHVNAKLGIFRAASVSAILEGRAGRIEATRRSTERQKNERDDRFEEDEQSRVLMFQIYTNRICRICSWKHDQADQAHKASRLS